MNKKEIIEEIKSRIDYLVDVCGFDPDKGYSQILGKSSEKVRAYGEFEALISLYSCVTGFEYMR